MSTDSDTAADHSSSADSIASDESSELDYSAFPEEAVPGLSAESALQRLDLHIRQMLGLWRPLTSSPQLERAGQCLRDEISALLKSPGLAGSDWSGVFDVSARVQDWICESFPVDQAAHGSCGASWGSHSDLSAQSEGVGGDENVPSCYADSISSDDSSDLDYSAFPPEALPGASNQSTLEELDLQVQQMLGLCLSRKLERSSLEPEGLLLRDEISALLSSTGSVGNNDWSGVSVLRARVRDWVLDVLNGEDADEDNGVAAPMVVESDSSDGYPKAGVPYLLGTSSSIPDPQTTMSSLPAACSTPSSSSNDRPPADYPPLASPSCTAALEASGPFRAPDSRHRSPEIHRTNEPPTRSRTPSLASRPVAAFSQAKAAASLTCAALSSHFPDNAGASTTRAETSPFTAGIDSSESLSRSPSLLSITEPSASVFLSPPSGEFRGLR